jgi:hypothetical protein
MIPNPLCRQNADLLGLPPELLLEIVTHLSQLHDLNSLLQTNRHLHTLLTPTLLRRAARASNSRNRTPLHNAAAHGRHHLVSQILSAGATASINQRDSRGLTPLFSAVVSGEAEVVSTLLTAGADPEASQERIKWTALHSAVFARRNDIAQTLLEAGASIEARLEYAGLSPLMMAVLVGDVEGVKLLLKLGCETEVRCINGLDAVQLAAGLGEDEILELLGGEKRQDVGAFNAELQRASAKAYYERVICRCGVKWCRWCSQRFVDGLSSAARGGLSKATTTGAWY